MTEKNILAATTAHNKYFEDNRLIIVRRWPEVWNIIATARPPRAVELDGTGAATSLKINGIHLCSCYDPAGEAHLQANLVPPRQPIAWLYGVGGGHLADVLLKRRSLRRLYVVIMNDGVFRAGLNCFDHRSWLKDARVQLIRGENLNGIRLPFAVSPADLSLTDDSNARLRDQIMLEMNTPYINLCFRRNENFIKQIKANHGPAGRDGDVAALFNSRKKEKIMVAAAGPTLEDCYPQLQNRGAACLIAVDAALKPLLDNGISPDIVVSIDGIRETIFKMFDIDLSRCGSTPLVYFPVVHPDVLTKWPGPRFTAYSDSPVYDEISEKYPKAHLFSAGTVTHASVDLAVKMGAETIQLCGLDFSCPYNLSHVRGAVFSCTLDTAALPAWAVNGNGDKIGSYKNLIGYLRDMEHYIAAHPRVRFINMSRQGAKIKGAGYADGSGGDNYAG